MGEPRRAEACMRQEVLPDHGRNCPAPQPPARRRGQAIQRQALHRPARGAGPHADAAPGAGGLPQRWAPLVRLPDPPRGASLQQQPQPRRLRCFAGYLSLLSQLTKVGDYDQATFEGEAAACAWARHHVLHANIYTTHTAAAPLTIPPLHAARFRELEQRKDDYKIVVIEGAPLAGWQPLLLRPPVLAKWSFIPLGLWEQAAPLCEAHLLPAPSLWDGWQAGCSRGCPSAADTDKQKVIASATLMIERKFIRNCGKVRQGRARRRCMRAARESCRAPPLVCKLGVC